MTQAFDAALKWKFWMILASDVILMKIYREILETVLFKQCLIVKTRFIKDKYQVSKWVK